MRSASQLLRFARGPREDVLLGTRAALLLLTPMVAAFGVFVFYPLVQLIQASLANGLSEYRTVLTDPVRLHALWTTLWETGLVTICTLLVGLVIAWTLRTTTSRFVSALFWIAVVVPMWMSVVVKNYAWIILLGRFGVVNWLLDLLHLPQRTFLLTPTAVVIGMVYSLFPFAVLPLYITFRSIPDDLIHAAEALGSRRWQVFTTVVWPLSIGGLFVTGVLVFVISIGFYVTPMVLGGPTSTFLTVVIQNDLFARFDEPAAAATGVVLIVVALALVVAALLAVGKSRFEKALG